MNWHSESAIKLADFSREWQRGTDDRSYRPTVGDSSEDAAERFVAALIDIGRKYPSRTVIVVSHGGVTVDALRSVNGDAAVNAADPGLIENGVPCGAVTRFQVEGQAIKVVTHPSVDHLHEPTDHEPA